MKIIDPFKFRIAPQYTVQKRDLPVFYPVDSPDRKPVNPTSVNYYYGTMRNMNMFYIIIMLPINEKKIVVIFE